MDCAALHRLQRAAPLVHSYVLNLKPYARRRSQILDEPLYAHFLKLTGAPRPYRAEVLAAQDNDGNRVFREQLLGPRFRKVRVAALGFNV